MSKSKCTWSGPGDEDGPWIGPLDAKKNKIEDEVADIQVDDDEPEIALAKIQEEAVMRKALSNLEILEKILEPLSFLDLKACRIVSKSWEGVASKVMLKKDCCVTCIRFDWEENTFHRSSLCQILGGQFKKSEEISVEKRLKSLNDLLDKSSSSTTTTTFPCTSFTFYSGSLERDSEARRFFEIQGERIKSLEIVEIDEDAVWCTPKNTFKEILLHKTPNLENLSIGGFDYKKWDEEKDGQLELPSLKTFSWHADLRYTKKRFDNNVIAYQILRGASNLERVQDFQFQFDVDLVLKAAKVAQVKELHLIENSLNPEQLVTFADAKPQVEELELMHTASYMDQEKKTKLAAAVTKLLQSSVDTLKVLDMSQFCSHVDIEIPVLPKLHKLTVGTKDSRKYPAARCFPIGLNLETTFPNLYTLDSTNLCCDESSYWNIHFPNLQGPLLPSVKRLIMSDQSSDFWVEKLHELCPNFVHLMLHSQGHENRFDFMLPKVFRHLQQLETLTIQIADLPMEPFCLDSAFTGIQEKRCQQMRASAGDHDHVDGAIVTKMRAQPSICSLEGLKSLKIVFEYHSLGKLAKKPQDHPAPITSVSEVYAFDQCGQHLQVFIEFDRSCRWGKAIDKMFEPLTHVKFINKHDSRNE